MTDEAPIEEILPPPAFGAPSVEKRVWEAFARHFSPEFADSWLYGAKLLPGGKLMPRTQTAWLKLKDLCEHHGKKGEPATGGEKLMADLGLTLAKPLPFQLSGQKSAREIFNLPKPK